MTFVLFQIIRAKKLLCNSRQNNEAKAAKAAAALAEN
jgi:hypothetical protein